jgi:thiol-disulfide isomerase/thioredoxin
MDLASPRTRSLLFGTAVAVVAVVAAVGGALVAAGSADDRDTGDDLGRFVLADEVPSLVREPSEAEGAPVPDVTFELLDGSRASFADYRGRPLVVNFFASTCPPCIAEMPLVETMHVRYGEHVGFLGLAVQDSRDEAADLVRRTGVTYETGRDPAGDVLRAFDSVVMPSTVFVTADGTVADVHLGELSAGELERRIRDLLA